VDIALELSSLNPPPEHARTGGAEAPHADAAVAGAPHAGIAAACHRFINVGPPIAEASFP
jgi:hypothetical protein